MTIFMLFDFSQLSGVRRGNPQPSQLQQLQMQIQMERQQVSVSSI